MLCRPAWWKFGAGLPAKLKNWWNLNAKLEEFVGGSIGGNLENDMDLWVEFSVGILVDLFAFAYERNLN